MEDQTGPSLDEDFEAPEATHTGPKGVISDWRKFKLESEDKHALPVSKKEILIRQMSSPYRSHSRDDKDTRERFSRKMSVQEYELINDKKEDEGCLQKYHKRCMQDMHQRLSFGPKYGYLSELQNGEQFLEAVEKERKTITIIVHIYEDGIKGCEALSNSLTCLAAEYPVVKFCKIKASNTGAGDRFSTDVLPTLLVYRGGELVSNFISVTEHFNEEFFAVDVETFLNEYGLLPEKDIPALGNGNMDEQDVE
ncbi:phosducin-like [Hemicordylus capensis]|uniref:phosducin-like n=1 Tax=Hemicordylus capensis TaxID=884348 RepID=UPI0023037CC6|nr:phosducin-like [Hemicordylus capensis]XP_053106024.1 phosducin-like [Hemicordylus capensis]XP_053106025.1 phosducin-like [Hemicordylus capensis]XP_053106026.1 phosducin-like [Hemicordylus capensis]XP_053106027.1 phosducin-like [Hemicordylus capensis]XP_053106028.1 phosducin-like [Hemicordylus capensis]XP_053106029.1 phosducin-like [Hemicordylus capensis]XP_053106030.1 phosducin-like [Hemicordylus capensis]XP_053106031.1 phosducin-like [Hemicordylus capensis]